MIGIKDKTLSLKKEKKEGNNQNNKNKSVTPKGDVSPAVVNLIQREFAKVDKRWETYFPDSDNLLHFYIYVTPDSGIYADQKYEFEFNISREYPFEPPKCTCTSKIWHPIVGVDGSVCLPILYKENWRPSYPLNDIFFSLLVMLTEPSSDGECINTDASNQLAQDKESFIEKVKRVYEQNFENENVDS